LAFWFIVAYISFTTRGNISFQNNLHCKAVAGSATTPSFDNGFGVDSCASDHICHDKGMFSTLDSSKYKTFEVVHGETITSFGVGDVELLVATTQGKPRVLTLRIERALHPPAKHVSDLCRQGHLWPKF